jgi:drug/metabolite transporter (DMT)-like permease
LTHVSNGVDRPKGITFAIAAASSYALVPNLVRSAYQAGVPALEAVCTRTAIVALVLFLLARAKHMTFAIPKAARLGFALMFLATFSVSTFYLSSLQFITVGMATTFFYTFPVIIALITPLLENRKPSGLLLALAALAFVGLVMVTGPVVQSLDWRGVALALVSALGCALQFFSGRMLSKHMQPAAFGSLIHILLLPVVIAVALYAGAGEVNLTHFPLLSTPVISVLAMALAYCAGYFFHMSAVNKAPSDVVAPYFNLEPVLAIVIATLFLGERLNAIQLTGIALVVIALILVNRTEGKRVPA